MLIRLIATLSDEAMDHFIGCKTSQEAWECLQEGFASVSMVWVNQLKTELHKKELTLLIKKITDNDFMIALLSGLPTDFEVIKIVLLAKDSPISLKDFQAQLLSAEAYIESKITGLSTTMSAMCIQGEPNSSLPYQGGYQGYEQGESSAANRSQ
ncbi:unnamed protein product [Malus baccata var. baccata]